MRILKFIKRKIKLLDKHMKYSHYRRKHKKEMDSEEFIPLCVLCVCVCVCVCVHVRFFFTSFVFLTVRVYENNSEILLVEIFCGMFGIGMSGLTL